MLVLHHLPQSICSQKVRLCLAEKGLAWESRVVDLARFEHLSEAYLRINPNGVVPALQHDGAAVVESTVICEYLDEVFPAPPLSPPTPLGRARMRAWLRFIDEVPTAALRVPSFNDALLPGYRAIPEAEWQALIARMPLRATFFRRMGRTGFPRADYEASLEQIGHAVARCEATLASQPWLTGDDIGIADLCMAPLVQRIEDLDLSALLEAAPALRGWFARIRTRPSWAAAFTPGSRLAEVIPDLASRIAAARRG
jgi:glutathione S-transferase